VDCASCHEKQGREHLESRHGEVGEDGKPDRLAPNCVTCHGTHGIRSHRDRESPTYPLGIPLLCGRCHTEGSEVSLNRDITQDKILENYSLSIHGEGLFKQGLTVSAVCTSCHTSHRILRHTHPESSINPRNVWKTCTACHGMIEQVHRKVIEGRTWRESPDRIPSCVECHAPHEIRPEDERYRAWAKDCMGCHGRSELQMVRDGERISLYVDANAYARSAHGKTECAECHSEVDPSLDRACASIVSKVDCGACHEEQVEDYAISTHGTLTAKGDPDAPTCLDCHAKHATLGKRIPVSPTFPRNVPNLCGRCHREGENAAKRIHTDVADIVTSYEDSIHGRGLIRSGLTVTATCSSCHSAHRELPPSDPRSTIHRDNVADTCGECHHGIEEIFKTSVHWPREGEDPGDLPSCSDCHTSHTITRTDRDDFRLLMMDQCGRCHEDEAGTFFETYHGKVSLGGEVGAAKCYDCHGTHDILPVTEPASRLSRWNVVETCAQCHSGAHRRFAGYLTHATHHDEDKYPYLFWTFWAMTALLVGTLSVAMLHTGAWLWRLALTRKEWAKHAPAPGGKVYRRFTKTQRTLHLVMLLSFFSLALTGMSLKFSYTGWAQVVAEVFGGFRSMGIIHRLGAVILICVFVLHLRNLVRRKGASGQSWKEILTGPDSIVFNRDDLKELGQSIKWFLGRGPRPRYGRFTYWEKFDYFAVFWGIAVIGSTGLVLWFPEAFTYVLPGWSVNVATIIHSDEALLAVGFIFTVHFFNTHFRPDKFPMDPVIFTGRVPVEELERDKPREYERLVSTGELEQKLVDPLPLHVERGMKIFGFIALAIGLTLIALIVIAMVFGYR
jgi:cytochrome b subunit of formate dehydrogenase